MSSSTSRQSNNNIQLPLLLGNGWWVESQYNLWHSKAGEALTKALVVSWLALATSKIDNNWSWRSLTLLQIFPAVIQLTFIYWVPESPRWLISKEHYDKALNTLAHFHANGDTSDFTVQFEFNEIRETIRLELEHKKRTSYLDFFRTKGNRYRLMLILAVSAIVQYSGSGLFSNYSNLIYESAGIVHEDQKIFV